MIKIYSESLLFQLSKSISIFYFWAILAREFYIPDLRANFSSPISMIENDLESISSKLSKSVLIYNFGAIFAREFNIRDLRDNLSAPISMI